ncbi:unnamed protein product [Dicrocoelium dendriticum]|nr:unnamed protein product [Dicrocoelium dendriticum]
MCFSEKPQLKDVDLQKCREHLKKLVLGLDPKLILQIESKRKENCLPRRSPRLLERQKNSDNAVKENCQHDQGSSVIVPLSRNLNEHLELLNQNISSFLRASERNSKDLLEVQNSLYELLKREVKNRLLDVASAVRIRTTQACVDIFSRQELVQVILLFTTGSICYQQVESPAPRTPQVVCHIFF